MSAIKAEIAASGRLSPDSRKILADMDRIQSLKTSRPPTVGRGILAATFILTALLMTIVFFMHLRTESIEFEGDLTGFSFSTLRSHLLPIPSRLIDLSVAGIKTLEIQSSLSASCQQALTQGSQLPPLRLSSQVVGKDRGAIGVSDLIAPAGSQVALTHAASGLRYRLVLVPPSDAALIAPASVAAFGPIRVRAGTCDETIPEGSPLLVSLYESAGIPLSLNLQAEEEDSAADWGLPIKDLSMVHLANDAQGQVLSTVLKGAISFDSTPGKQRLVRAAEHLEFVGFSGVIHTVVIAKDRIKVRLTGTVNDVKSGETKTFRTLMPTWFEWLTANHGLITLWSASIYLFGLALAVLRWWRPSET
jgi:hypothetical protein